VKVKIRLAQPADAAHLPAIEASAGAAFRGIADLAWIADDGEMSVDQHHVFIAAGTAWVAEEFDGVVVGFLCAELSGEMLHIREVSVLHDRQGLGVGRQLIAAAIALAEATDLVDVTLTTFRDVPWNAPYYHRLGFRMLAPEAVDDRLAAILASEIRHGLPGDRRCAMRLLIGR
jgi:GNAT superfamily N-acetyltransferase